MSMKSFFFLWIILIFLVIVPNGVITAYAQDTTIRYVAPSGDDTGACADHTAPCHTIQYAIDQAAAGDEIYIASTDNAALAVYTDTTDAVITLDKNLTLRGGYVYLNNMGIATWLPSPAPAIVDGEQSRRALYVSGDITATVELLSLVNGHAERGGNVYVKEARVSFIATPIMSGTATYGGGMYLQDCRAALDPSDLLDGFDAGDLGGDALALLSGLLLVQNNTAEYGGGVYVSGGMPMLSGLGVYSNTATVDGGGLYLEESGVVIAGGVIMQNRAENEGGGFYLTNSAARIAGTAVYSNTAVNGAGFYLNGPLAFSELTVPIIANSYVRYNRATGDYGGGFYFEQAIAGAINNIIANNYAPDGAAMYLWASSPQFYHSTIARNSGQTGIYLTHKPGALWPPVAPIPSLPSFTNTIVVTHTTALQVDTSELPAPLENNATLNGTLWYGNDTDTAGAGIVTIGDTNVYTAPLFTCTGDPPDCAKPYHILTDSMAVDAGVEIRLTLPVTDLLVDIDLQTRPSGSSYDLGADEVVSDAYSVWIFPPLSSRAATLGQTVTHTHWLLNTGTQTDTYTVTFHSDAGWSEYRGASTIRLGAQTSRTLQISVVMPDEVAEDVTDTAYITATSQNSSDTRARAMAVTSVFTEEYEIFLPAVLKDFSE